MHLGNGTINTASLMHKPTPEWLHATLASIFGSSIAGLYIVDDCTTGGGNLLTALVGRVGVTPTINGNAPIVSVNASGRRVMTPSSVGNDNYLTISSPSRIYKSLISVAQPIALPASPTARYLGGEPACTNLMITSGSSTFYSGSQTVYVDGVQTTSPGGSGRMHVYESDYDHTSAGSLYLNDYPGADPNSWNAPIGMHLVMTDIPTATQRAQCTAVLKAYYLLP